MRIAVLALGFLCVVGLAAEPVRAQSLTPMRGEVNSFTDRFAIRVYPGNPYQQKIRIDVKVYDADFNEIQAIVAPSTMMIGPGDQRSVNVVVPFGGAKERKVRVCAESIPFPQQATRVRAQVCGKFLARRKA